MAKANWKIDWEKHVCMHEAGLIAYFDAQPTISGAIRCLGPFVTAPLSESEVRPLVQALSLELSSQFDGHFLVWGAYEIEPDYEEHVFPLIGQYCGFSPKFSLGGELYPSSWKREWSVVDGSATHRSGFMVGENAKKVDLALFHPSTFQVEIELCRRRLATLLSWEPPLPSIQTVPYWRPIVADYSQSLRHAAGV